MRVREDKSHPNGWTTAKSESLIDILYSMQYSRGMSGS